MARDTTVEFVEEKNAETQKPINLYRINISDTPAVSGEDDLFLAEYDTNVEYYRTDSGVDLAQSYMAFPMRRSPMKESTTGKIETMSITVGNASREMMAFLESRDGLIGRKVTIRQTFSPFLVGQPGDDPAAHVEDVYHIDSVASSATAVVFNLSPRIDVLEVVVPLRRYARNRCSFEYKSLGCYISDGVGGFTQPAGFSADYLVLDDVEHIGQIEVPLYAGEAVNAGLPAIAFRGFPNVNVNGFLNKAVDKLRIDLKCNLPTLISPSNGQIELTSSNTWDSEEWSYPPALIAALGIDTTYATFDLPLVDFAETGGAPDDSKFNFIRWFHSSSNNYNHLAIGWRNAKLLINSVTIAQTRFKEVDVHGLTKTNGVLRIDLKCDNPAKIGANSQIEVTSSGGPDLEEWNLVDLTGSGWNTEGQPITDTYQTFNIPLSTFNTTGGELVVSRVNFVRAYAFSSDGSAISLSMKNARMTWGNHTDACSKTFRTCRWHNNVARYGGFPSVAHRRSFRA